MNFWSGLKRRGAHRPQVWETELSGIDVTASIDRDPTGPHDRWRLLVTAHDNDSRLQLRQVLITAAENILIDGIDRNVLYRWTDPAKETDLRREAEQILTSAARAAELARDAPPAISTIWWNKRANFGDMFGPILVRRITGREVVHASRARTSLPPLYTAGSVITFNQAPGSVMWGPGLIKPLTAVQKRTMRDWTPPTIHAVRGPHTRTELIRHLGWEVPAVYGDPALLAPRLLPPERPASGVGPITIPHGMHESLFADRPDLTEVVTPVSPSQGPQAVIRDLAGASHCVASSLHGVLTAHAFGVPWTWLRIVDRPLVGDEFKFEDFFASLERDQVSRVDVRSDELTADVLRAAVRQARVPADHHDLEALERAFPHHLFS